MLKKSGELVEARKMDLNTETPIADCRCKVLQGLALRRRIDPQPRPWVVFLFFVRKRGLSWLLHLTLHLTFFCGNLLFAYDWSSSSLARTTTKVREDAVEVRCIVQGSIGLSDHGGRSFCHGIGDFSGCTAHDGFTGATAVFRICRRVSKMCWERDGKMARRNSELDFILESWEARDALFLLQILADFVTTILHLLTLQP